MSLGRRRLAAIMFTDMVGYTALGQVNESLSLALVDEQRKLIRPILSRHNGKEVKTIGDAFLVEFPSALDGVRCAYDIQRAIREFNVPLPQDRRVHLRVGIHLGDVVENQGDISGDAVNIASRIEPLAEDGGVCLSRPVYDQVQNKFELRLASLGPKQLKNVGAPVEVFKMTMPWDEARGAEPALLDKKRIAVLPFTNMSPDPSDEYFSDGMTEELITSLSGVNGLSVIARTSVMKYKGAQKGASQVANELNVGTLVEGSVRKAGNKVRITVQLIDAKTESHAWAKNYDKQLDDIFAIQSDVAKQVADVLQVRLLSTDKMKLEKVPTSNIEAYTLYLKGQHYFYKAWGDSERLKTALVHFEEAVANDPNFALAYAQLAYCYNQLGFFGMIPSKEAGEKAKEYVERALELDDSLAEAHQVKGRILRNYEWDFPTAEREFKRAIELSPSFAEAYGGSALLLSFNRRSAEAIAEVKHALELDPVSGTGAGYAGTIYLYAGLYDEAIEQFSKNLEIEPKNVYAKGNLGLAHIQRGMVDIGVREVAEVATIKNPSSQSDLAYAYAKAGRLEELRKLLERLLDDATRNNELAVAVASAYANLGDADRAVDWLEKAYNEHVSYLVTSNSDFVFDAIRGNHRFQTLMRKVGWTNTL
ncbi:MAG TPA: adenylate/guanylate cyclase domain-containing protein [Nitrososphaerales archaeon]|nr:adenylate/guanylate cyclase domain-containing protein [Nitrososphaerales archaeon]